jgi:predicted GNAT family N-acyltransferase
MVVREITFKDHRDEIRLIRRESYGADLIHEEDAYDSVAHHFASLDKQKGILGVIRLLRSDEVEQLEIQGESRAGHLVYPPVRLIMECSRACMRRGASGLQLLPLALAVRDYALAEKAACLVAKSGPLLLPLYRSMGFKVMGESFFSDHFTTQLPFVPIVLQLQAPEGSVREDDSMVW